MQDSQTDLQKWNENATKFQIDYLKQNVLNSPQYLSNLASQKQTPFFIFMI